MSTATGVTTVLAFSKNTVTSADTGATSNNPTVSLIAFQPDGTGNSIQAFFPDATAVRAHFVAGTSVIGVVTPTSLELFQNSGGVYTNAATLSSDGALNEFQGSFYDND